MKLHVNQNLLSELTMGWYTCAKRTIAFQTQSAFWSTAIDLVASSFGLTLQFRKVVTLHLDTLFSYLVHYPALPLIYVPLQANPFKIMIVFYRWLVVPFTYFRGC